MNSAGTVQFSVTYSSKSIRKRTLTDLEIGFRSFDNRFLKAEAFYILQN